MDAFSEFTREALDPQTSADRLRKLAGNSLLRLSVAANPSTPPDVLEQMSNATDLALVARVAANPNTPTPVLLSLAEQFPEAFLANPVLPLLLIESPCLLEALSPQALLSLLRLADVPHLLLGTALHANDETVRRVATMHVAIAGEVTDAWRSVLTDQILLLNTRPAIVPSFLFDPEILPVWLLPILALVPDASMRVGLLHHPELPPAIIEQFALDSSENVRAVVALNESTSPHVLAQLADDPAPRVRGSVALNGKTPLALREVLATDPDPSVRSKVAMHSTLPEDLSLQLLDDTEPEVRARVIARLPLPPQHFEAFAHDADPIIRRAVAINWQAPLLLLEQLARDAHPQVRKYTSINRNTPVQMLLQLGEDADSLVRSGVALNRHTPDFLLERFAADGEPSIRSSVAANLGVSPALLVRLAADDEVSVRLAVCKNPATPLEIITHTVATLSPNHLSLVQGMRSVLGAKLPPAVFHPVLKQALRSQIAQENSPIVRLMMLASPLLPPEIIQEHSISWHWIERYAIACNPNAPRETRAQLMQDGNRYVRAAAKNW